MYTCRTYPLLGFLRWTGRGIFAFTLWAVVVTALYHHFGQTWLAIPWLPIALLGTAVSFLVSFKNNASYGRLWEARAVWGAIVNDSRTWGIMARDFVTNRHAETPLPEPELYRVRQTLTHRHIAWLTALRYQLRQPKSWESMWLPHNAAYRKATFEVPEYQGDLEDRLSRLLPESEYRAVVGKANAATQIVAAQSAHLRELMAGGYIEDFRHMEMVNVLSRFYDGQGKSERIKNFPYPRQFATLNAFFTWLFIALMPFGMLNEFNELQEQFNAHFIWLNVPFSALVSWVFFSMEKIGEVSENPFEGGPNDTPMNALSRTIEIDLRQMLDEEQVPEPVIAQNNVLL